MSLRSHAIGAVVDVRQLGGTMVKGQPCRVLISRAMRSCQYLAMVYPTRSWMSASIGVSSLSTPSASLQS
jgi:hypothetical protein